MAQNSGCKAVQKKGFPMIDHLEPSVLGDPGYPPDPLPGPFSAPVT